MPITREITNVGKSQPILGDDGLPAAGVLITFILVNQDQVPAATFDKTGSLIIAKEVSVTTDANGEFTVSLWPTTRGRGTTFYLCRVQRAFNILAALPDGETPMSWGDFVDSGNGPRYDDNSTIRYDDGSPVDPG